VISYRDWTIIQYQIKSRLKVCEDWIQGVLGLDFTIRNVSYWKHKMTFLMSCMTGKSPHCHCHSQASSWEWAHWAACIPALEAMTQAQLPALLAEASRQQFAEAAFPGFLHCMQFRNECLKRNLLWAFTFLCQFGFYFLTFVLTWGGDGECCSRARMESVCVRCTVLTRQLVVR
jgi:hypothetical protein